MIPKSVNLSPSEKDIQVTYKNNLVLIVSSKNLRKFSPSAENKNKPIKIEEGDDFKDVLINKIEDSECEPKRVKIDGSLVIRGSARLPKEWK